MNPVILLKQKEIFLEELARSGNVTSAARTAGWRYPTIADEYRKEDPQFDRAWSDAQRQANDALIMEARRRAVSGVNEPVYFKGEICGSVTRYSDKLLEVLLKAEMPEKFKDNSLGATDDTGVLVVPRSEKSVTTTDWEKDAIEQQQRLLENQ